MDSLVELVPQSSLVRLGASFHPCTAGPAGHLTVHGHELRPLTLAECDLIAVYAADGAPEVSAALALRIASVRPADGTASTTAPSAAAGKAGSAGQWSPDIRSAAVESVALFLAGATGTGSLRGAGPTLVHRFGLPLAEALELTVLAADGLAPPPPPTPDDSWTTFEIVPAVPDAALGTPADAAKEVFRVRDLLATRFAERLAAGPAFAPTPAETGPAWPHPPALATSGAAHSGALLDRWGAPVEGVADRADIPSDDGSVGSGWSAVPGPGTATWPEPAAQGAATGSASSAAAVWEPTADRRASGPRIGPASGPGAGSGSHPVPSAPSAAAGDLGGPTPGAPWWTGAPDHGPPSLFHDAPARSRPVGTPDGWDRTAPLAAPATLPAPGPALAPDTGARPTRGNWPGGTGAVDGWHEEAAWVGGPADAHPNPLTSPGGMAAESFLSWSELPGTPPTGEDDGTLVDAVALRLALELQAIADLHGVAR